MSDRERKLRNYTTPSPVYDQVGICHVHGLRVTFDNEDRCDHESSPDYYCGWPLEWRRLGPDPDNDPALKTTAAQAAPQKEAS